MKFAVAFRKGSWIFCSFRNLTPFKEGFFMKFDTKAIHIGNESDPINGAVIPPVYLTTTYKQKYPGKFEKYNYARGFNPNFTFLEQTLAALEGASQAVVFSSGMAAFTAVILTLLKSGDTVLGIDDLYGGTYRLFINVFRNFNIGFEQVDMSNEELLEKALQKRPKLLILESPTNPLLKITDIKKVTEKAKKYGVATLVDNTFASPYFQNPLKLGADIVLHSTTKYIAGHSDVIGGVVISDNENLTGKIPNSHMNRLEYIRNAVGLNPGPFECWLIQRGVKTLGVRMEKHQQNAMALAKFLHNHPKVKKVYYPGLPIHENHNIAKKQMSGFSGIVSVEFKLSFEEAKKLITYFKIITLAESLGGIESLVDHPASMTHGAIPKEDRAKIGLSDGLIRLSVGIEDADDLIADISQALNAV